MWRLFAALLLLLPCVALAQESPETDAAIAEGLALRREGQDEQALARFFQAWELSHAARARAQMALAEQALGRWVDAELHLREALEAPDPWVEQRRALLEEALTQIGAHLGSLEVLVSVDGAEVIVDGRSLGPAPLEVIRLPIGSVSLEVRAAGYQPVRRTVEIAAGSLARESIGLIERPVEEAPVEAPIAAPIEPPPPPPPPSPRDPWFVAAYVALGVGVVSAIGGGIALGVREGYAVQFSSDECLPLVNTQGRVDLCPTEWDAGHAAENAAIAIFVVTGAAAIASGVLFGVAATTDERAPSVACAPAFGGVACSGRF